MMDNMDEYERVYKERDEYREEYERMLEQRNELCRELEQAKMGSRHCEGRTESGGRKDAEDGEGALPA